MADFFDVAVRGGDIIDGSGKPRFRGDLGIRGDRIVAIGSLGQAQARATIDAAGKVVAPGFIDVHNHSDGWLLKRPHFTAKTTQGFTTEVLMADGISYAPVSADTAQEWIYYLRGLNALAAGDYRGWESLADYMSLLDGRSVHNTMTHVPYANVRTLACGWRRDRPDDFQMRQIVADIRTGMEQGAVGLSTGLDYIAQCFANTDELVAACRAIAPYGGLYVTHIRYKAELMPALREAVEIGRRAGVAVHVSHLKGSTPQIVEQVLEFIDNEARREVDFSFDVYPYQSGSTMLSALLPYEVWEDGPTRAAERLRDPVIVRRFAQGLRTYKAPLDRVRLAWLAGKADKRHQGKAVLDYAREMGASVEDALVALLLKEDMAVLMVVDEGDDALVRPLLQHDLYMMGSDGIYFDDAPVHPRVYGSSGRLLGRCVREWKLFSLEEAVHKLTGRPAHRFGAPGRGILKEGNFADVVVFDPQHITDHATYAQPHRPTEGVEHVLVNGVPVIRDAKPVEPLPSPLPGRWLRFHRSV